ncbi:TPA: hypothetical protein ACH3X1_014578 [Trebouxia sp. C0004]
MPVAVSKKIRPAFSRVILAHEKPKQTEADKELLKVISTFVEAMDESRLYFFGTFFSLVDIMLPPWLLWQPLILKEYKDFEIPSGGCKVWNRWSKWLEAVRQRPTVVNETINIETISGAEHYRQILKRYANNTAQSEAASEALQRYQGIQIFY